MSLAALALLPGLLATGQEPGARRPAAEVEARLAEIVAEATSRGGLGPAAFVVVRDGAVLCARGFGAESPETNEPVDPERSVFLAASVSKVFVATAAEQLREAGALDLDAPVTDFVPSPDDGARAVRVVDLLTHTSGIEERMLGTLLPVEGPPPELEAFFARHPPRFPRAPGVAIRYSNIGMALAGRVVERASGLGFCDYVEQRIFAPLGMRSSSFRQPLPDELARRLVSVGPREPPRIAPYPSGSLAATPADMARFLLAHLEDGAGAEGRLLSAEAERDLQRRHFGVRPDVPGVALGFFEGFVNGRRALWHTGDRGHHSLLWMLPEERAGFFLVYAAGDGQGGFRERFMQAFADLVVPAAPFELPVPVASAAQVARYAGTYRTEAGSPRTIEALAVAPQEIRIDPAPDGALTAVIAPGAPPLRLVEVAPGLCRSEDGAYVAFGSDARGRIVRIDVAGPLGDPFGAERIGTLERALPHALVVAVVFALFLLRALWTPVALLARVLRGIPRTRSRPGPCARAWRVSGWTSTLVVLVPVMAIAWLASGPFPLTGVPWIVPAATGALTLAVALATCQSVLALAAWRRRDGPAARRLWLGLAALATVPVVAVLAYWNLLGCRT